MTQHNIESPEPQNTRNETNEVISSILWFENKPGYEDMVLSSVLLEYFDNDSDYQSEIEERTQHILEQIGEREISKMGLDISNHTLTLISTDGAELLFDLSQERGDMLTPEQLLELKEHTRLEIIDSVETFSYQIDALEYLFDRNRESNRNGLSPLDVLDTDEFGSDLKGLNILEVSEKTRTNIAKIDQLTGSKKSDLSTQILVYKQRYLGMIMGIGERYEAGTSALPKTGNEAGIMLAEVVQGKTIEESLNYLVDIHRQIEENSTESTSVARGYKLFTSSLHRYILQKIIDAGPQDPSGEESTTQVDSDMNEKKYRVMKANIFRFINILRGDDQTHPQAQQNQMKDKYRDTDILNLALMHLIMRPGGAMEKLKKNPKFEMIDPYVGDRTGKKVLEDTLALLSDFEKQNPEFAGEDFLVNQATFEGSKTKEIFNLPDKKYIDLTLDEKMLVSYLLRINMFLKVQAPAHIEAHRVWKDRLHTYAGPNQPDQSIKQFLEDGCTKAFLDTEEFIADTFEDAFEPDMNDTSTWLSGKSGEYFDLGEDADIINLFNDINGAGLDPSDDGWMMTKTGGKILAIIALSIAIGGPVATLFGGGALAQGALIGLVSGPIGNKIMGKGYDRNEEFNVDTITEALINIPVGLAGGQAVKSFGSANLKTFAGGGLNKNNGIFTLDLLVGMGIEMIRSGKIDHVFHGDDVFKNAGKDFYDREKAYEDPVIYGA